VRIGQWNALRRLGRLRTENRVRLLSVAGAVVLVVLCGTSAAVWLFPGRFGLSSPGEGPRLGVGTQPGASAPASADPTVSSSAPGTAGLGDGGPSGAASAGTRIKATYKTVALLGLVGLDVEVTVTDPAAAMWTVILVVPEDRKVELGSTGHVKLVQEGTKVTLTPIGPPGNATFTVRYPALLAAGKSVTCTINGDPCSGI
jgi:hypothetical protein